MLETRFCRLDEIDKLQRFIDEKWRHGHVLATSKELLLWQHGCVKEQRLNFVVAVDSVNGNFVAILGFIPLAKFDDSLLPNNDIWLSLWKADETASLPPGVGLSLLEYLNDTVEPSSIGVSGINDQVTIIYEWLGYTTGHLSQYYIADTAKLAEISVGLRPSNLSNSLGDTELRFISSLENIEPSMLSASPKKTISYYMNRYGRHPWYQYRFLLASVQGAPRTIFVIRRVEVGDAACLRIIDVIGDMELLSNCASGFVSLLQQENAEYIDCLNYGISETIFEKIGFRKKQEGELIPEYFEPFEKKNVSVGFAYFAVPDRPYLIFKGDGDQDRPNRL